MAGCFGCGVVGAVMAVAARSLHMVHGDLGGIELERAHERAAQREDALAMRPHREMAVLEEREAAGRRYRGVRDVRLGVGRFKALAALRVRRLRRADDAVDRRTLQQPVGFLLQRRGLLGVVPGDVIGRG
jgi:hypothetical protein